MSIVIRRAMKRFEDDETPRKRVETKAAQPVIATSGLTEQHIRQQLHALRITEKVLIHTQNYEEFLHEKGIVELGSGAEGAVFFLRGHVVKVVNKDNTPAALREIAHMLFLNAIAKDEYGGTMGERQRQDWPALLWIYVLSNGSISIGMRPFDNGASAEPGTTLEDRLFCGPAMTRAHALKVIRSIAHSLAYAHAKDIIHHDLKPANIFIPGDESQGPVLFDLGQSLWRQGSWGRDWLKHSHNLSYWYNGTYRYMHLERRMAHLAGIALCEQRNSTVPQMAAFERFRPSFYDDVFSFARIVRDFVRSPRALLNEKDKLALKDFYARLMGISTSDKPPVETKGSSMLVTISGMFRKPDASGKPVILPQQRFAVMQMVLPELEKVLLSLDPVS